MFSKDVKYVSDRKRFEDRRGKEKNIKKTTRARKRRNYEVLCRIK
jgi:hypothetical protein